MNAAKRLEIFRRFHEDNPEPKTELAYSSAFELLIAVILSAHAGFFKEPRSSVVELRATTFRVPSANVRHPPGGTSDGRWRVPATEPLPRSPSLQTTTPVMDVGMLRLPSRGWFVLGSGEDMEKHGAAPHHLLWPEPGDLPQGRDAQLTKAIEVLRADVAAWQKRPQPKLRLSTER